MIKIAICDSSKKDRDRLKEFINHYEKEFNIIYCLKLFASGEELLESKFMPDILFLDIAVGQKDGIQIGAEIKQRKAETLIIYITFLGEKITTAMNYVHAFGFFDKPISQKKLFQILSDAVIQIMHNSNYHQKKIRFVSEPNAIIDLCPMDIYYFEYENRKIKIAAKDGTFVCKGKIRDIAEQMEEHGFTMSHQSFVVNLYQIERISAQMLVMKNGEKIPLAQKRASAFRKRLMQAARNDGNTTKTCSICKNIVD